MDGPLCKNVLKRMRLAKRLEFMLVEQMTNYFKMCRCHCCQFRWYQVFDAIATLVVQSKAAQTAEEIPR